MTVTSGVAEILADAGDWDHMGGWGWGMAIFGWLFMLAFIALVVWLIISAIQQQRPGGGRSSTDRALEVLAERYARGEIDREEFLQRKADLEV